MSHVICFLTPWTVTHHIHLSKGFHRQKYWSGLPFSSAQDLPNPESETEFTTVKGIKEIILF